MHLPIQIAYDAVVYTTNDSAVASVDRWNAWELEVCDESADGMQARTELRNLTTGQVVATAEDANGAANDDCGIDYAYPTPCFGERLRVTVWVQDGGNGTPRYRAYADFTT